MEAYQFVQGYNGQEKLHLVLLDLDMPIMDGYEACSQILRHYSDKDMFFYHDSI
jgi:CheY-like chemotaxis protein